MLTSVFHSFSSRALSALLIFTCMLASTAAAQGTIEVRVTNIKPQKGSIMVGLFNNEKDFLKKAVQGKVVKIDGKSVTIVFDNLPAGLYGISVIHDENENGELDTNIVGLPKEGFAFGNNAMGTFGPPSFEKASVEIKGNSSSQEIALRYF